MRMFPDWQERFETFFNAAPAPRVHAGRRHHRPLRDNLPSPFAPIEVIWEQIETITAYVGSIEAANLVLPLQS